jgi:AcrR family transcriptional regulator
MARNLDKQSLEREDWLRAARRALLKGGVEAVRVAKLARDLGVTKGSFYWHFKDRDELLELLLREWETELSELIAQLGGARGRAALASLMQSLVERARLSEEGKVPSDAAIFAWASVSPAVARRVNRAEEERIKLLARLVRSRRRVEVLYLAWLGFVARGQRAPAFRKRFPAIARTMLDLLTSPQSRRRTRGLVLAALIALAMAGPAAARWTVYRQQGHASFLELPTKRR